VANSFDFARYDGFVRDVSSYGDINDLYIAADILVTDYSSVFFDFANLERPIIFYMYDLEHYANEMRGFYLSLDELPGPVVKDETALIAEIKAADSWKPDDKYNEFRKRFNPYEDGNSSKRVLAKVIK
jgi:CDP-glycerol glycerophosphotransferase